MSRSRNTTGWIFVLVALTAIWWFILPPALGGRTTLFMTKGVSMEPNIHQGDLAVLHKRSQYKVGEVIAFHSSTLKTVSLHRIVSIDSTTGITTRGDNNNFDDLDHPSGKQIVGRMDHRVPGGAKYVHWFTSWPVRTIGFLLIASAVYGAVNGRDVPQKATERLRRTSRRLSRPGANIAQTLNGQSSGWNQDGEGAGSAPRWSVIGLLSFGLAISLLVMFVALSRPSTSSSERKIFYTEQGQFGYSASTSTGGDLVYADGQVSTGDPIYLSLVDDLFVTYEYQFSSSAKFKGEGTLQMVAELKGKTGWVHTIPLSGETTFSGTKTRVNTSINIREIRDISSQVEKLTKISEGGYTLSIKPTVHIEGTLANHGISEDLPSSLSFTADSRLLRVTADNNGPAPTDDPNKPKDVITGLTASKTRSIDIPAGTPTRLRTAGMNIGLASLRLVGLGGSALFGLGLVLLEVARRRKIQGSPETLLFQDLLVPVASWGLEQNGLVIDVESLSDLARIAETHNILILRQTGQDEEIYLVSHNQLTYRFRYSTRQPMTHDITRPETMRAES